MFDEVLLYALAGGIFAVALAVAIFLLFLRRYCWRRASPLSKKSAGDLEKGTTSGTEAKNVDSSFAAQSRERLLSNYGAASPTLRTLSMDSIVVSKTALKKQSSPPFPKSSAHRQTSFPSPVRPFENSLCEKVPEDESVDGYDYDSVPKYEPVSSEMKNSRVGPPGFLRRQSSSSTEASIGTIKPDLYLRKGSLFFQTGEGGASDNIGKVHLRFRYDFRRSDFIVTVIQAELPPPVHDCYLRMFLTPDDSDSAAGGGSGGANKGYRQSKMRRRSAAFAFNEEFKFPIAFSELVEKTLVVQAFDCSTTSRAHQQLGEVCLELRKADPSADIEVLADLMKIGVNENVFGSIEVALSYLPSVQRLTVSILQAKGLQIDDVDASAGTTGLYVKCLLFQSGSKAATKKKKISPVPVVIPREDQLPHVDVTWKEQVTFHLPEAACKSASLRLLVCSKHSRGGPEKVLGQLNLGSDETSRESRQHWRQMLKEKMESSVWHKLQVPTPETSARADSISSRLLECD